MRLEIRKKNRKKSKEIKSKKLGKIQRKKLKLIREKTGENWSKQRKTF